MSQPKTDNNPLHLYKPFRDKVDALLEQANRECKKFLPEGATMVIFEGYRSQELQLWDYQSGRTRPGPIVTNKRIPDHHGHGLAVDIVWKSKDGELSWDFSRGLEAQFGHCVRSQGLEWGGDWPGNLGDVYHAQANYHDLHAWEGDADKYLHTLGLTTPPI